MATVERDAAPGVHRVEHAHVNLYLIEGEDGAITVVDAGLPGVWRHLPEMFAAVGVRPDRLAALVLTHAHFDHVGTAAAMRERLGVPVWAHADETALAAHPYSYRHERSRCAAPLTHPRSLPILARMTLAGALTASGVDEVRTFDPTRPLAVPGAPVPIFTPGHTFGHTALHLPDRGALITGDALVTLDPYTGESGPQIVSGSATADSAQALGSLAALRATGVGTVLPGHGDSWRGGVDDAVALALRRGAH